MKQTLLKEFSLSDISIETFCSLFWSNSSFYYNFLTEQLHDIDVSIGEWETSVNSRQHNLNVSIPKSSFSNNTTVDQNNNSCLSRQIRSFHPSKISFPGLPSHAESIKVQTLHINNFDQESLGFLINSTSNDSFNNDLSNHDNQQQQMIIKETNNFIGIPYADYFSVNVEWIVNSSINAPSSSSSLNSYKHNNNGCNVRIYVSFTFHKSTWLQGTIESNTKAELITVCDLWLSAAQLCIDNHRKEQQQQYLPTNLATANITTTATSYSHKNNNEVVIASSVDMAAQITSTLYDQKSVYGSSRSSPSSRDRRESLLHRQVSANIQSDDTNQYTQSVATASSNSSSSNTYKYKYNDTISNSDVFDKYEEYMLEEGNDNHIDGDEHDDDDDMSFYDCEEGNLLLGSSSMSRSYSTSPTAGTATSSSSMKRRQSPERNRRTSSTSTYLSTSGAVSSSSDYRSNSYDSSYYNTPYPSSSSSSYVNNSSSSSIGYPTSSTNATRKRRGETVVGPTTTIHDIAVTVVETVFVFVEFTFWKIHTVYTIDLIFLFNVTPRIVWSRFISSFLPGYHSIFLTKQPDLYGPVIALFLLPQSILLSMQTAHMGCSHSFLLGNALIVSLCLWISLAFIYRLLAFVVAPKIEWKHCFSISGYSLFSWCIALTVSFLWEVEFIAQSNIIAPVMQNTMIPSTINIQNVNTVGTSSSSTTAAAAITTTLISLSTFLALPTSLPFILFGLPTAIAQGCLFWEYTPFSSMIWRPRFGTVFLQLPQPIQRCHGLYSNIIQKILWSIPKIVAFILVAGTHYQFLWYIAHVFVPGRKRSCQLSALMQPGQYADILTQKELVVYTMWLLKQGKKIPI